ncbi:hypothetical protein, partial [Endozoicomonas sp.]|uniref:hypothetical protein n=1 Tax=Endozoicomonas sp. TaxID=1892382 RepID=UPI00383A846D
PDAFIDGDVNLLRAETELRLPEQTQLISESVASNTVDQTLNQAEEITEVPQNTIEEASHFQSTASSPIESDNNIHQVEKGESISEIAMNLVHDYPGTDQWQAVMSHLVALNPEVFIDGDINKLLSNALLILPARDDFEVEAENQELPEETFVDVNEQTSENTDEATPPAEVILSVKGSDQYQVSRGESVSAIAMKLAPDYPEAHDWKGIMEQLVTLNPGAFINGDENRLRSDAFLTLPAKEYFEVEAENYEQPADADFSEEDLSQAGTYEVSKGESLSSISIQLLPEYPNAASVEAVMDRLVELNPQAFVGGDANRLLAESILVLPAEEYFNVDSISEEESENRYQVTVGENISAIALKLLPNYPQAQDWKVVMNRLVQLNPEAFIEGNMDRLRADAFLTISGQGDLEIEAENQELPESLIPDSSFNKDHPGDKKKVN